MGTDMNKSASNDRPTSRLVEGDVAIEWNDAIERGTPKEGYEVAANRKENEDHVHVKDKRSCPCNSYKEKFKLNNWDICWITNRKYSRT